MRVLEPQYRPIHYVAAIGFAGVCWWFIFERGVRPPGLTYMDIGVHEMGHVLFRPFGEFWMLVMGSGTQVLFPLSLALYFLLARRDLMTGSVLLTWAGEALGDTAIYVADAPNGFLPLLGGEEGDWTRILGPEHLSKMHLADEYASSVRHAGMLVIAVSVGLLAFGLWSVLAERRRTPAPPNAQPPTTFRPAASPADMWR